MNRRTVASLERAKGLLAGFTPGQRAMVAVAAIGLVLGAVALTRFAAQPTWSTAVQQPDGQRRERRGRPAEVAGRAVPAHQRRFHRARARGAGLRPARLLAGKNLPAGDAGGWSLLDQQGMTSTDFQQNVAYQRALEGELGKTLQAMSGVQTAIVHLAIPKKDVFTTSTDKPTASVLLALAPGTSPHPHPGALGHAPRRRQRALAGRLRRHRHRRQRHVAVDPGGRRGRRRELGQRDRRGDGAVRGPDEHRRPADARPGARARARRRAGQRRARLRLDRDDEPDLRVRQRRPAAHGGQPRARHSTVPAAARAASWARPGPR